MDEIAQNFGAPQGDQVDKSDIKPTGDVDEHITSDSEESNQLKTDKSTLVDQVEPSKSGKSSLEQVDDSESDIFEEINDNNQATFGEVNVQRYFFGESLFGESDAQLNPDISEDWQEDEQAPDAYEEVEHEPVGHEPVGHESVGHEPIGQKPVEPFWNEPLWNEPVGDEAVAHSESGVSYFETNPDLMNREEMSESIGHVELGGSESEHSSHVIYGEPPLYDDSESFEPEEERIANENEAVQFEHQTKSVKVTDHEPSEPSVVYEKTKSIDYEEVSASEPAKHEELVQPRNAFRKIYDMDDLNTFESDVVHGRSSHASVSNPDRIVEVGVSSDGSQIPEHNDDHTHTQHVNQPVDHDVQAKHESQLVDDHVQTDRESQSD
eukprot:546998_1